MIKFCMLMTCLCIAASAAFSQSAKGTIGGRLMDAEGKEPVGLATVAVYQAKDSSLFTYRLSDHAGNFRVPGLPLHDSLRMIVTHVGASVYRETFLLTKEAPTLDFDTIRINPKVESLDEVLVFAEAPPVVVKNDTIEFNANSFKTLPSALVEDLLRKLPGVQVDAEGNIVVNGRKVSKLYVDGKEFFGSDPQMATKNLPANIIDKVQVTDDKEQLRRNPDLAPGDVGQVINLKLKKAIKKGWFGKAYAGGGTDERYEAGGIFNLFKDTMQVSLLGYTNNLNRSGFGMNDIMNMGGFNRSGASSMMTTSSGGFAINDISFGGTGQGIQRSTGSGVNFNHQPNKDLTLNFQYFYGQVNSDARTVSNTRQFFEDTVLTTQSDEHNNSVSYSHRLGGSLKWNIDSTSEFQFRPSLALTRVDGSQLFDYHTRNNFDGQLNESLNHQQDKNEKLAFNQSMSYYKTFKKEGRWINILFDLEVTGDKAHTENNAQNVFYEDGQGMETLLNQLRLRNLDNLNWDASVRYREPFSKSFSMEVSNTFETFNNRDRVETFYDEDNDKNYIIPDPALTERLKRSGYRNNARAFVRYKHKNWSVAPGVSYQLLKIDNAFSKTADIYQQFNYILPSLNVTLGKWRINYYVYVSEPRVNDLQPVQDNTNPLFIRRGNPNLKPSKNHQVSLNSYGNSIKSGLNYNVYASGSITDNATIYARVIDKNGVQITTPVNANGVWYAQSSASINKDFRLENNRKLSVGGSMWATYNQGLLLLNSNRSESKNWRLSPTARLTYNWKDVIEFRQDLSLTWRKSLYSEELYPTIENTSYISGTEIVIRAPKHWVWESNLDYRYNPQVSEGLQQDALVWSAGVSYLFMKDERAQLRLSVFDLLNQNKEVYSMISENRITDTETTVLRRYFMLTFTYNFRKFGGKVGGKERFFLF